MTGDGVGGFVSHARDVYHSESVAEPLVMSSSDRSPNTLSRGLWSTAMIKLLQPRTKNRALSRASATARASPSTGA